MVSMIGGFYFIGLGYKVRRRAAEVETTPAV
jgi:hypothetical protein